MAQPEDGVERLKMSELAHRSGVPAATIKHYVREGLLPEPVRTSRNMAWYEARWVPRIRAIKELQRTRFLPLALIKDVLVQLDRGRTMADAVEMVLRAQAADERRSRAELIEAGGPAEQLAFFENVGLVHPDELDGEPGYSGDDLTLLRVLGAARRAGITPQMLPHTVLPQYMQKLRELAELELEMFERGVMPHAGDALPELVEAASRLSETLVLVLRRKMLRAVAKESAGRET